MHVQVRTCAVASTRVITNYYDSSEYCLELQDLINIYNIKQILNFDMFFISSNSLQLLALFS